MKKPQVSIIILTYARQLEYIKKCLQSFKKVNFNSYEIIVVDNASDDNTTAFIKKHFPNVKIIKNKKNFGFCEGNNIGLKNAKGELILFLNNDTEVAANFLDPLVSVLEKNTTVGVVQPKIRQMLEREKLDACASFLTNTGLLYHFGYSQNQSIKKYNKKMFMYSAKGAGFMTRKSLIKKIGLFDSDYFAYFEETDFCHRVWLSGYSVEYTPASEIFHLGGAEFKGTTPPNIQFNSYKNRICTYIKNLGTWELLKILPVHVLTCLIGAAVYLAIGKFSISKGIINAIFWNITHLKQTLKKRKYVQSKIRKVSDRNFIKKVKHNPSFSYYKHFLLNPRGKYEDMII
jgi:hypothetical protein